MTEIESAVSKAPEKPSTVSRRGPVLPRWGLPPLLIFFMGTPLGLIAAVWFTMPPVREAPLEAEVEFIDFVNVVEFEHLPDSEKEKTIQSIRDKEFVPAIVIRNSGSERWENLSVSLNDNFDFISPEAVEPGGEVKFYLHRFITRQGDGFRPLRFEIRSVKLSARLTVGERAFFESEISPNGVAKEQGGGERKAGKAESSSNETNS